MSDNYEFLKTNEVQDATDYSPYVDKQYNNYINDINNNGVYTKNSLTLVNFDLGQIDNRQKFTETSWFIYCTPPITSFAGINLAAIVLQHPLPNCRLYYSCSQVTVEPQKSIDYVQRNRNKKVHL
jgi:hypothetical protein